MNAIMPDGYFYEDHIVFGDPGNGSVIARGYAVNFPDLSASDDQAFSLKGSEIFFDYSAHTWRVQGYSRNCAKDDERERAVVRLGVFRHPASATEPD